MDTLRHDIVYALRRLLKAPGFTLIAVLTLGLGVGANSAIFGVVNGILLEPLPFPQSERLVGIYHLSAGQPAAMAGPNFIDLAKGLTSIESAAAYNNVGYTLTGAGDPVRLDAVAVSASFFDVLETPAALGRTFIDGENTPGRTNVVILSHALWRDRFGGDRDIINRSITLSGTQHQVIGVMPERFAFPDDVVLWTPVEYDEGFVSKSRGAWYLGTVARLKPGATPESASAEAATIAARLQQQFPGTNTNVNFTVRSLKGLIVGDTGKALWVLVAAVGFVLLIACANVANLMLARAAAREQELSVRAALGASRTRLVRQLLTESLALGLLGGLAGLLIAAWATDLLVSLEPNGIPRLNNIGIDLRVAAFTGVIALATSITFGLLPAFQMTRGSLVGSLRERGASSPGGTRGTRLRGALVVAEMALAVVLLIGAGLLIRSFANLTQVDPGFRRGEALTFRLALPGADYATDEKKRIFYESLLERMRAIPGVTAAAATMRLPLSGDNFTLSYKIEGRPPFPQGQEPTLETRVVTAGYFEAMGMRIVRGRTIQPGDNVSGERVVLLSERAVREQFSFGDPIGQKIVLGMSMQSGLRAGGTVVGIVADVHEDGLAETQPPQIYVPHAQFPVGGMTIVARTAVPAPSITPQVRALIASMDPKLPMAEVRTLEQQIARSVDKPRFYALLLGSFAALALSLAAIGIFGVMSYQVSSRTREIGIRLALGAQRDRVMRMVLTHALSLGGCGVAIGLAAGWFLTKYLESQLFELTPTDPVTFSIVAGALLTVALTASWMPARRATRVDPMVALRGE